MHRRRSCSRANSSPSPRVADLTAYAQAGESPRRFSTQAEAVPASAGAACSATRPWPDRSRWSRISSSQAEGDVMAVEVAKYQFQSWVRKGIATQISEQDTLGNPGAVLPPNERASVPIGVSVNATPHRSQSLRPDRPRRHHRHPPRHDRAHRAARRGAQLRAELSRVHRVLRRGLSLALHARRSPTATGCGRGFCCWC